MRAFIALEPAEGFASDTAGLARMLSATVRGRFMPRANYHVTLAFLGDVDEACARDAIDAIDEACKGAAPVDLVACGLGSFGRPRDATLWLDVGANPKVAELTRALRGALSARGVPFDGKPFRAHITLVRRADLASGALAALPLPGSAPATKVTLFKSELSPEGASYKPLYTANLGA